MATWGDAWEGWQGVRSIMRITLMLQFVGGVSIVYSERELSTRFRTGG